MTVDPLYLSIGSLVFSAFALGFVLATYLAHRQREQP